MTAASPACPYAVMPQFLPEWQGEGFWLEAREGDAPIFAIGARICNEFDYFKTIPGVFSGPDVPFSGRLLFNGGQWISQDFRGHDLSQLTCKLLHAVALLLYDFDHIFALVELGMWESGLSQRQGFTNMIPGITWTGYYPEPQELVLISMTRQEAVQSLQLD